jgi:para-aminobenzoate synthetase
VTRHAAGRSEVVGDDVFDLLEQHLADDPADAHWVGYFGYACRPDLPALARSGSPMPDAVWMRTRHVQVFHHPESNAGEPALADSGGRPPDVPVPDEYAAAFAEVQEQLHAGNSYEVNLTHRIEVAADLDPVTAYLRLRELNPAPYAGLLQHDVDAPDGARGWLLSSSPERYALVTRDGDRRRIETKPIKGTTPRGASAAEDDASRRLLATDAKYRAENLMIVDLLRHDLAQVCEVGSVEVPSLMAVESYPSVHQLVSTVRGSLRADVDTVSALRALFPAGSMTGAPKLRTMQVIAAVEDSPRTAYAGSFGWLAADGRADLGVVIRTLTTTGDGCYRLGTGGGITVGSRVEEEYAEAQLKAERLLRAL